MHPSPGSLFLGRVSDSKKAGFHKVANLQINLSFLREPAVDEKSVFLPCCPTTELDGSLMLQMFY